MPEGDTIHRAAAELRAALAGQRVVRAEARATQVRALGPQRLVGQTVRRVETRGKHLLAWFAPGGLALHTHLGMHGSWHVCAPDERWRKPAAQAAVVVGVADRVAVCFRPRTCELLSPAQVAEHPGLASLGPDALAAPEAGGTDLGEARRRLDARAGWTAGEALLDQGVLAGVGNVFKCEVLFVCGVDPWARVGELDPATRDALLAAAERLLRANAGPDRAPRTTTGLSQPSQRLHVYGRPRRPCPRCATPVRAARQGEQARVTYWCPQCQGPGPDAPRRRHDATGGASAARGGRPRRVVG